MATEEGTCTPKRFLSCRLANACHLSHLPHFALCRCFHFCSSGDCKATSSHGSSGVRSLQVQRRLARHHVDEQGLPLAHGGADCHLLQIYCDDVDPRAGEAAGLGCRGIQDDRPHGIQLPTLRKRSFATSTGFFLYTFSRRHTLGRVSRMY